MHDRGAAEASRSRSRAVAWLVAGAALPAMVACATGTGSVRPPGPGGGPAAQIVPLVRRYPLACESRSPGDFGAGFRDPRNGGECWACPHSNPIRTWSPVTAHDACATKSVLGINAKVARARYLGPYGKCPRGDVEAEGTCSYCPQGSSWSAPRGGCVRK